jgi:hypothetical protein
MKQMPSAVAWPKTALFILVFVLIGTAGLFAQSRNHTDEPAPAESGPVQNVSAVNDDDLVIVPTAPGFEVVYEKYNPSHHDLVSKHGKLLGIQDTKLPLDVQKVLEKAHATTDYRYVGQIVDYTVSPYDGSIWYVFSYFHAYLHNPNASEYDQPVGHFGILYLPRGAKKPIVFAVPQEIDPTNMASYAFGDWIDSTRTIMYAETPGVENPAGVIVVDTKLKRYERLEINQRYLGIPVPYDNGRKLFYYVLDGDEPVNMEMLIGKSIPYSFDLETHTEERLQTIPNEITNKQDVHEDFARVEQNFLLDKSVNSCNYSGAPLFYLPWPCNKAMCVERDGPQLCSGSCTFSASHDTNAEYSDCNLNPGSTYTGACNSCPNQTCGHYKPAIDFGDGGLWFQTGTPVLASANGEAQRFYQPSGAGNYVAIRHLVNGVYVYSLYMHLSQVASNIPTGTWISVARGYQIGTEGGTGGNYSPHYHFQLKDGLATGDKSFYPVFAEYGGCTPKTGRTYISRNVPTDGSMVNGFDCASVTNLSCSSNVSVQGTTVGMASRYASYGNQYHNWDETGPERIYRITTTSVGTISATLSNVVYSSGNDLDVFILGPVAGCSELDPLVHTRGSSSGLSSVYSNAPVGTYYIVIDGMNASRGSFTLSVSAPCSGGSVDLTDYNSGPFSTSGRNVSFTMQCANLGSTASGAFRTHIFLSTDRTFSQDDYGLVALLYTTPIQSMTYRTFSSSIAVPSNVPAGNYYLMWAIDALYQVTESDETNNGWATTSRYAISANAGPVMRTSENTIYVSDLGEVSFVDSTNYQSTGHAQQVLDISGMTQIFADWYVDVRSDGLTLFGAIENPQGNYRYDVYDILGAVVCSGDLNDGVFECVVPSTGAYVVRVTDHSGGIRMSKVVLTE